jgi:ferredoxin-type protein NapH
MPLADVMGRLQAADIRPRGSRVYQAVRHLSLATSLLAVVVVPLWQLRMLVDLGTGAAPGTPVSRTLASGIPAGFAPAVGATWSVKVWILEFLDPLATFGVLAARSLTMRLFASAALTLGLVALLGRYYCGWLCPYRPILALSNTVRSLLARFGWTPPDVSLPRRTPFATLGLALLVTAVAGTQLAPLVYPPSILGREVFRVIFYGGLGLGALLILGAFLFDTFVARAGICRYVCPGAAVFTLVGVASPIRVKLEKSRCTDCTACDVACNLLQRPMSDLVDSGCERCGVCIAVCPTDALRFTLARPTGIRRTWGEKNT